MPPQPRTRSRRDAAAADRKPGASANIGRRGRAPGTDVESAPRPEPKQAEAEILTDEEPQDSDVAVRSEIKPDNPAERMARLFFGADTLGPNEAKLQPWREGEAPVLMPMHPSVDPDIKRAAIATGAEGRGAEA